MWVSNIKFISFSGTIIIKKYWLKKQCDIIVL